MTKQQTAAELAAAAIAEGAAPPDIAEPGAEGAPPAEVAETEAEAPAIDVKKASPGQRVRKGAPPSVDDGSTQNVLVRVTKAGHGQVHDGAGGTYDWADEVVLPRSVGKDLEEAKLAEIVGTA